MRRKRTWMGTIVAELARGQSIGRRRRGARRLSGLRALRGLLAVPLLAWMAAPVSTPATVASKGAGVPTDRSYQPEVTAERPAGTTPPLPEVVPPAAAAHRLEGAGTGWFAHRDARTGELMVPPPQVLERRGAAGRLVREPQDAVLVERRLPNGAVEIDLPEGLASPLYGWLDEHGELHTGHEPPAHLIGAGGGVATNGRGDRR